MIYHRIVNTDHSNNTLSVLEDLPELGYSFLLSEMGEANWTVPLSHPNLTRDGFAPRRTDWRLGVSTDRVNWFTVQGGICGPVGLKTGVEAVPVVGYDWLVYLKQPFPFDYASEPSTLTAAQLVENQTRTTQQILIQRMLDRVTEVVFSTSFSGTGWAELVSYPIMYGDTTDMLDHIKSIGALNEPKGFEFWCDWDKTIRFYSPRITPVNTFAVASFLYVTGSNGLIDIDWGNIGPLATRTVGLANGLRIAESYYTPSITEYRTWLELVALRDNFTSIEEIEAATSAIGHLHRFPQKSITVTIKPDEMDPLDETAWFFNHVGQIVYVDSETYFLPYHRIQAYYLITKMDFKQNNGTWLCDLTLDQLYDA